MEGLDEMLEGLDPMEFEGNITPPPSPNHQSKVERNFGKDSQESIKMDIDMFPETVPCFDCQHERNFSEHMYKLSTKGYLIDGILTRILGSSDPWPNMFQGDLLHLFGHRYITSTALEDKLLHLFSLARQKVITVERLMNHNHTWTISDHTLKEATSTRTEVLKFFQYVAVYIHRFLQVSSNEDMVQNNSSFPPQYCDELLRDLLAQLQEFLQFVGRLSNLESSSLHRYAQGKTSQTYQNHFLFHTKMDLHWMVLVAVQCLHQKLTGTQWENEVVKLLNQEIKAILEDLVYLASLRLRKFVQDIHHIALFPCSCLQEFWWLMIHLIDERNAAISENSFWSTLQLILTNVIEKKTHFSDEDDPDLYREDPPVEDKPFVLSLWLAEHLAALYQIDHDGNIESVTEPLRSHWPLVQFVFLKALSDKENPPAESHLHIYLRSVLTISQFWGFHNKLLTFLWNTFSKQMNKKSPISVIGLQGLACVSKSAISWYESFKQRSQNQRASLPQEDSFNLFVRILAVQLSRLNEQDRQQSWKQLQGRLFSKFHSKFLASLTEEGLVRLFTLFLTLALVVDVKDLTSRVMSVLQDIPSTALNAKKKIIVNRGLLTFALVHQNVSCDFTIIADWLVQNFNSTCWHFKQENLDPSKKTALWSMISSYISDVQDVIESSTWLNLSEDKLISQGFSFVLSACSDSEISRILTFSEAVIQHFRSVYSKPVLDGCSLIENTDVLQKKHSALVKSLWSYLYPFITVCACRQNVPAKVADVAVAFTLLAMDLEKKPPLDNIQQDKAKEMINYIAFKQNLVKQSVSVQYLCQLLPNSDFTSFLDVNFGTSWQLSLVQTWFYCSLSHPGSSDEIQELSSIVFKFTEVADILRCAGQDSAGDCHVEQPSVFKFIQACGAYVSSSENMEIKRRRSHTVLQAFGDLTTTVKRLIRGQRSQEEYLWIYRVIGHTFKYCAGVLYTQIPGLLTELILFPSLYNPNKPISTLQLQALRENLPGFIEGLASMNLKADSTMRGKLKDIIVKYFPRLQPQMSPLMRRDASHVIQNHPFQVVLYRSCARTPSQQLITLRQYMVTFLKDAFMNSPSQKESNSPHLHLVIKFFQELLQKTLSGQQVVRDALILLKPVLEYLLLTDQMSIKTSMTSLLTLLMEGCKKCQPQDFKENELLNCFRAFLSQYIFYYHGNVFKVLTEAAVHNPTLLQKIIPDTSEWVARSEHKRAVGTDMILRKSYVAFLRQLGATGNAEAVKVSSGAEL
ncbi:Protein MMS22-like [Holothuria leucospilota]|uniref:Protein MMS22-like n=1 Tax=Holothuria leucospilota TaxID=206669 RepID=A0A9Q1C6U0_HOLLE|nr:Protein MMS22-like [Holothuria leucospilota]